MSIEYMLDLDCRPRRLLGLGGLLDASKLRRCAADMALRQAQGAEVPNEYRLVRITAQQTLAEEKLTPVELVERAKTYDTYRADCRGCPANTVEKISGAEHIFGCHGTIDYPIPHELEFLLFVTVRLISQRLLDHPAAGLLYFILETGVSGETVKALRETTEPDAPRFTLRDDCLTHGFVLPSGEETSIDTDQMLETLFFGGRIDSQVAKNLFAPFFQIMESVVGVVGNQQVEGADRLNSVGVVELRAFGKAVISAAELGCNVVIDR
jgi:hypothetical protein